jgi:hypothetical protein
MTSTSNYTDLLTKKRKWTPVRPTYEPVVSGAEDVLARALALRALEIPVGNFIEAATKKEIPATSLELLESNIVDEIRHDQALQYAADSFGNRLHNYDKEASAIVNAWVNAPEHTVLKAMVLERSVFFVLLPILRFLGNSALRTVSSDISMDEQIHVVTNSLFCKDMGIELTTNLDRLRKTTVAWMVDKVGEVTAAANPNHASKDFWIRQSDSLLYRGVAPELAETRRSRMPAFFELDNRNTANYV